MRWNCSSSQRLHSIVSAAFSISTLPPSRCLTVMSASAIDVWSYPIGKPGRTLIHSSNDCELGLKVPLCQLHQSLCGDHPSGPCFFECCPLMVRRALLFLARAR